jgi:uncharacterized protein with PQ loop repeat
MLALQVLYIIAGVVALSAGLPQMRKLIMLKDSTEFSLQTWLMWTITQVVSATYVSTLGDPFVLIMSSSWAAFYALMVVLIVKYDPVRRREVVPVDEQA